MNVYRGQWSQQNAKICNFLVLIQWTFPIHHAFVTFIVFSKLGLCHGCSWIWKLLHCSRTQRKSQHSSPTLLFDFKVNWDQASPTFVGSLNFLTFHHHSHLFFLFFFTFGGRFNSNIPSPNLLSISLMIVFVVPQDYVAELAPTISESLK